MTRFSRPATCAPAIVAATLAASVGPATATDHLNDLKWKARPIVILSDSRDDPRLARQIGALDRAKAGVNERDIKVMQETVPHGALRRRLGVSETGFAVVLVGKDGDIKKVWREPVDAKQIFTIIDRMPMRRDEMKG